MPGKLCFGEPDHTAGAATLSQSKSYCDGRKRQVDGGIIGDNPHLPGSPDALAWANGFDDAFNARPKGCCAV